jgi:hypothetical protein
MIDAIYIPTLGRPNQITWDGLPNFVKDITYLIIQPHEVELHKDKQTVVLPEGLKGITNARRFIYEYAKNQRYFVLDDDCKLVHRRGNEAQCWHNGVKTKRIMTEDDWSYMLETTSKWLDSGDITWGGFRTGGLPPAGKEYIDNTGTAEVFFFDGKQLPSADELDWELSTAEDISLSLQLLSKGYPNRVWDRFVYISDFVGTQGGCVDMGRDLKMINDNHAKLIEKFPEYVSYNGEKEMMGGIFNKIKIQYKKAYNDSQKSKTTLEEWMI